VSANVDDTAIGVVDGTGQRKMGVAALPRRAHTDVALPTADASGRGIVALMSASICSELVGGEPEKDGVPTTA
jgi:hypothetical protein